MLFSQRRAAIDVTLAAEKHGYERRSPFFFFSPPSRAPRPHHYIPRAAKTRGEITDHLQCRSIFTALFSRITVHGLFAMTMPPSCRFALEATARSFQPERRAHAIIRRRHAYARMPTRRMSVRAAQRCRRVAIIRTMGGMEAMAHVLMLLLPSCRVTEYQYAHMLLWCQTDCLTCHMLLPSLFSVIFQRTFLACLGGIKCGLRVLHH